MEERIIGIVAEICGADTQDLSPDLDLFEEGLLDSFGALQLLVTLSESFGVDLDVSDVAREQVATVEKIEELIAQRRAAV